MPWDVSAYLITMASWTALGVYGFITKRWKPWILVGITLAVVLNVRFIVPGLDYGFGHTTAITDVSLAVVHGDLAALANVVTCPANECTIDTDGETLHTSWAVVFFDRFANGSSGQKAMFYGHIVGNTIAMALVTWQLLRPVQPGQPNARRSRRHRQLGMTCFGAMGIGVFFGAVLAGQHTTIPEYGGAWSMFGLWEMSACVAVTGVLGVRSARRGAYADHRVWMWRHAGSLWGSYFGFRAIMFFSDPIFINYEGVAWNLSAWGGAPVGIALAELARRRLDRSSAAATQPDLATV
ncbi:MAG: hypothetical protein AAGC53_04635 [Actinomycetota bacterium]